MALEPSRVQHDGGIRLKAKIVGMMLPHLCGESSANLAGEMNSDNKPVRQSD